MATADEYAAWIVANPGKRGSPEFETVVQAYEQAKAEESGSMTDQATMMAAGEVSEEPQGRGIIGGIVEAVTGRERATEATRTLPEWTSMPELNTFSFQSAKTGLGTLLAGPEQIVQIVQANFPGTEVMQDEKGNFIMRSSIDGKDYAIPPGFSMGDVPRAAAGLAAFTPAGRSATILGGGAKAAATQAGIEASQVATGAELRPAEQALNIGMAGATQAAVPTVVRAVGAAREPVERMIRGAPEAPRVEPTMGQPAPVGGVPGGTIGTEELVGVAGMAAQRSAIPGRQTRAMEVLAGETAPDPKVLEAARRLNIEEFLQPDHVTTNQVYREFAQAVKSVPGSEARRLELQGLEQVGKRANDLIDEIGGTRDYSTLSDRVQKAMQSQVDELNGKIDTLYKDVIEKAIPKRVEVSADNILSMIRQRADDLGGFQNLSAIEKEIFGKLAPRQVKVDGIDVQKLPTYALLDDVRKDIGSAYKQQGPFKDADRASLDRLYGALSADQMAVAARYGADDALRAANQGVQLRKAVEKDMTALFGKQLHLSMVSGIEGAIKGLAKGDEKKLINLLKAVPKDMRQEVVASGLKTAFGRAAMDKPIGFNEFATWYQGLLENKQAYSALMTNLPPGARKQLSDLYRVSNSVAKASRERIATGRIQAVSDQLRNADSMIGTILETAKRGAIITTMETGARAVGLPGAGVSAWVASALTKQKTSKQKAADALLSSPEFSQATKLAAQGQTDAAAKSLAKSRTFTKFAKEMGMPKEMGWKTQWILRSMQTERQLAEEQ
jgi:hypothetical protein